MLGDGRRLHLQHGPIDLVVEAFGEASEIQAAYSQARRRFETVLSELVAELPLLRRAVQPPRWEPEGPVARRMMAAVWPHRGTFVTPMAAVAGGVADEVMGAMAAGRRLSAAYVNNSGDIAVRVSAGESLRLGVVGDLEQPAIGATAELRGDLGVRGVATSGWRGRSHSLGIADAVTVLAGDAASADVAATLVANAVDADHPAITRAPASSLDPDTDLGGRPVTTAVGALGPGTVERALDAGRDCASRMVARGLAVAVALTLCGVTRVVERDGAPPLLAGRGGEPS